MDAAAGGRGGWLQHPYRGEVAVTLSRRRSAAARPFLAAAAIADAGAAAAASRDRAVTPGADDGGRDRRGARSATFDGLALAEADRAWQALPARPARATPTGTSAAIQ